MNKKYALVDFDVLNADECVDPEQDKIETVVNFWEVEPSDGIRDTTKLQAVISFDGEFSSKKIAETITAAWPDAVFDTVDQDAVIEGPAILDYMPMPKQEDFEGREELYKELNGKIKEMQEQLELNELIDEID